MKEKIFPKNSLRRKAAKKALAVAGKGADDPYSRWRIEQKDKIEFYETPVLKNRPLISVVVPAFNTPKKYLDPFVRSVVSQTYAEWELVIVDASSDKAASERIEACKLIDTRIKVVKHKNEGISANTNVGIRAANGTYIAFMDHDDTLAHDALQEAARVINEHPSVGLVYTDEDKLAEDGSSYLDPHFKPDWSPHLLAYANYITHFVVARKDLVEKAGYLDPEKDGAQDFDFLLRLTDLDVPVRHIPKILYHWRVAQGSTASDISNKSYVLAAGEKALDAHFKRRKIHASAKAIPGLPGWYKATYSQPRKPTVIVTPFANATLVKKYLSAVAKHKNFSDYHVIAPYDCKTLDGIEVIPEKDPVKFLRMAIDKASEAVVIVSDFVFPENSDWASELAGLLLDKRVHAVTPAITRLDKSILDMGIVQNGPEKDLLFYGFELGVSTPFGNTRWPRDVDELTGSVTAVRKGELKAFLKDKKNPKNIINSFSQAKDTEAYNVAWVNVTVFHAKVPLVPKESTSAYFNPNLHLYEDHLQMYANEQQIMDALITIEG